MKSYIRTYHIQQSVQNLHLVTSAGYNNMYSFSISQSQQCSLGQGKLVMVLLYKTAVYNYAKIIIHDLNNYFKTINLRMLRLPRVLCPISLTNM